MSILSGKRRTESNISVFSSMLAQKIMDVKIESTFPLCHLFKDTGRILDLNSVTPKP